jgi:hypothetical protein
MSRWNNEEIEKAKNLLSEGKTYEEIGLCLNRGVKSVKLKLNKSGIKFTDFQKPKEIKLCQCCGGEIKGVGIKYCSSSCSAKVNNVIYPKRTEFSSEESKKHNRIVRLPKAIKYCLNCNKQCKGKYCGVKCNKDFEYKIRINDWKSGKDLGFSGKTKQIKKFIRRYLLDKSNYCCSQCGWNKIHPVTNNSTLEINHIDGDAENCIESNLEVVCPNCHSLTTNFRALNKNSKRVRK